jgi:hypothetical protein
MNLLPAKKYAISKVVYLVLLEVSLIVDMILALAGYEWLKTLVPDIASLAIVSFIASSVLGGVIYLLHIWQMEYLTKNDKG